MWWQIEGNDEKEEEEEREDVHVHVDVDVHVNVVFVVVVAAAVVAVVVAAAIVGGGGAAARRRTASGNSLRLIKTQVLSAHLLWVRLVGAGIQHRWHAAGHRIVCCGRVWTLAPTLQMGAKVAIWRSSWDSWAGGIWAAKHSDSKEYTPP